MISGWKAETARRRCHQARGSSPISHATPCTVIPSAAARRASSPPCLVTRTCSTAVLRLSSRHSSKTCCWPPRHSRPESTCNTRIGETSLRRDFHDSGEYAAQGIEFEGLLEEWPAQLFEELQRVAADRVARGKNDAVGDGRVHARERVEHLAATQPRHAQIANDQVEWLHQRALQGLTAVARQHHLVTPALERRLHVVEDVRLVINNEYPQVLEPFRSNRLRLGAGRQRASLRAN